MSEQRAKRAARRSFFGVFGNVKQLDFFQKSTEKKRTTGFFAECLS